MDRATKHMSGGYLGQARTACRRLCGGTATAAAHRRLFARVAAARWRMRVALAQALFAAPELLLLDEPTNHLDLEACVWLEDHLSRYPKCLVVVSHSQDFLNSVCTHTVWLHKGTLKYYGGNYANFVATVADEERLQLKVYEKQQADMSKLEEFVRVNKVRAHEPRTAPQLPHPSLIASRRSRSRRTAWLPRPRVRRRCSRSWRTAPSSARSFASPRSRSNSPSAPASRRR
jgi:ATPase subunit of ABC transporter with duplicated ATPase domains